MVRELQAKNGRRHAVEACDDEAERQPAGAGHSLRNPLAVPDFAPDRSKIGFVSTRNAPDRELFVLNADGTQQTLIHKRDQLVPTWQPRCDEP